MSTELHEAAVKRNVEAVRSLLQATPELAHARDEKQRTPLQLAARGGCLEVVELLVANGADVNTTDEKFQTPLQMAAYYGFVEVAVFLLSKGALVNAGNRWQITPLHLASNFGHKDVVELLLKRGADVNSRERFVGFNINDGSLDRCINGITLAPAKNWGGEDHNNNKNLAV